MPSPLAAWTPSESAWQRFRREPLVHIARWLHRWKPALRTIGEQSKDASHIVTVVCISDTHQHQPLVPDGDLLVHAGDLTDYGTFEEIQSQLDWLAKLPHKHKVVIAGNHDRLLDPEYIARFPDKICEVEGASRADLNWHDLVYLNNSSKTLRFANGREVIIFGSPWTPDCGAFAFQYPPIRDVWTGAIPRGTDILLTHGPPKGYLDLEGKGCPHLIGEIAAKRPRLVVFGHIHSGHGEEKVGYRPIERGYQEVMAGRGKSWVVLGMVFWLAISWMEHLFMIVFWRKRGNESTTTMINAAIKRGAGEVSPPVIVYI